MSAAAMLLLALAGGVGAVARFVIDAEIKARWGSAMPWGTIAINISGSLLLGLLAGVAGAQLLDPTLQTVLGTGLLGGYTTFSTASVEAVRLIQERRLRAAGAYVLSVLVLGGVAAGIGLVLGAAL